MEDRLKVDIGKGKQAWLCKTCKGYLQKERMPPMCSKNLLTIKEALNIPLTELEANLISPSILFMKIWLLPVSRGPCLNGKVINVPIGPEGPNNTMFKALLPRAPQEGGLIAVKLKRKLAYQNSHTQQLVNVQNMLHWVHHLKKAKNPYFKNIFTSKAAYEAHCAQKDPEGFNLLFPGVNEDILEVMKPFNTDGLEEVEDEVVLEEEKQEDPDQKKARIEEEEETRKEEEEEQIYRNKDPVKKHQLMETGSVVMNDTHPEMDCRMEDKVVSVAPGEGKTPVDFLYDHDWDIKAFPHLNNPDGGNGLFQKERPVNLTYQNFFNQRILNIDKRFSRHPPYLFSAVHFLEKKQIRRNMNLSYTTGHQVVGEKGQVSFHHHDGYIVLNDIKNSPSFMKKKKSELLAKLDNFGPFHWFFTLSCADI